MFRLDRILETSKCFKGKLFQKLLFFRYNLYKKEHTDKLILYQQSTYNTVIYYTIENID